MPLTHRDHACSLVYATGHMRGDGRDEGDARPMDLDWELLARPRQTTVIYMGVGALPVICEQLIVHGLSPATPAALVERATQPGQRTVVGTVETLPALAQVHEVRSPALIVIGAVAALHGTLAAAMSRATA
jgi:uroporphyrin-III C-methyltransferase